MQLKTALLALIPTVSAHFRLYYPLWRGDALASTNNASISEWFYPCAGFTQEFSANNRTQWPMTGGAVVWNSSHPDALTYINLGLGDSVTSFNVSLQGVYNETGAGVTCLPNPGAAAIAGLNLTEGQNASIQVITISGSGASLYNCADITFTKDAPPVSSNVCQNTTGVSGSYITSLNSGNGSSQGSSNSNPKSSGATGRFVPIGVLIAALGVAAVL